MKFIDLAGKKYDRWTVLKRVENNRWGAAQWLCRCDCGTEAVVLGNNLRRRTSQSCGCLQRELAGKIHTIDRVGHRYGKLTVIKQEASTDKGETMWLCKCDCGNETIVRGRNLHSGTSSCGCLQGEAIKLADGEAAFNALLANWKGDAKRRGYAWALSKDQVKHLTKQPCYYCGALPAQTYSRQTYNGDYVYNGIDRLDNDKGYITDNVVPCCKYCNFGKNDRSITEFRDWVKQVYEHFV